MLIVIVWLFYGMCLLGASMIVHLATVPTYGEALFDGKWYKKTVVVLLWGVCAYLWYSWLGAIEINV
jgi:hypothetical protein